VRAFSELYSPHFVTDQTVLGELLIHRCWLLGGGGADLTGALYDL